MQVAQEPGVNPSNMVKHGRDCCRRTNLAPGRRPRTIRRLGRSQAPEAWPGKLRASVCLGRDRSPGSRAASCSSVMNAVDCNKNSNAGTPRDSTMPATRVMKQAMNCCTTTQAIDRQIHCRPRHPPPQLGSATGTLGGGHRLPVLAGRSRSRYLPDGTALPPLRANAYAFYTDDIPSPVGKDGVL